MTWNRNHILVLGGASLLFLLLYMCFDKVPPKQLDLEKSRLINIESTGISNLVKDAMVKLEPEKRSIIEAIGIDIEKTGSDTILRIERLKSLSGTWFEYGFPAIAGSYAEDIALLSSTESAWSMAGTTYALCVKKADNQKEKEFCSKRSVKAFENAISMAPDNIELRINLAICYVDNPAKDDPMKGILMLRELNAKHPDNVAVLNQLAKLALQTNQIDRALLRLQTAINLEPENQTTICLLAKAYKTSGNQVKAIEFEKKCVN